MPDDYELVTKFWIDTDGYSDRDREMFVCGFEFADVLGAVEVAVDIDRPVHTENEDRIRMMLRSRGVSNYRLGPTDPPTEGWLRLQVPSE